jgi:putative protease
MKTKIGKITHYFSKIGVAVIELEGTLKVGDKISIETVSGEVVEEQTVKSMQIDKNPVKEAKAGQAIGLKVGEKVHENNVVYKVK